MAMEYPRGARWLARSWEELRAYAFEWVVSTGDGVLVHSESLEQVIGEVAARGLTEEAVYAYVDLPVEASGG